jgi:DNA polymerase-3 subunit alpha (Gram-positive type)
MFDFNQAIKVFIKDFPEMLIPVAHARQLDYVIFDLETTGLDAKLESITQIAAVRLRRGKIVNEEGIIEFLRNSPFGAVTNQSDFFSALIKPTRPISAEIEVLTGISNAMVKDAPEEASIIPAFIRFIEGSVLVAHNGLRFDMLFLRETCERCGVESHVNTCLDTLRVCRKIDLANRDLGYSLQASLERHNIKRESDLTPHNALVDALFTARLLAHFLQIMAERERDGVYLL